MKPAATKIARVRSEFGVQWVYKLLHLHKLSWVQWVCLTLCSISVACGRLAEAVQYPLHEYTWKGDTRDAMICDQLTISFFTSL